MAMIGCLCPLPQERRERNRESNSGETQWRVREVRNAAVTLPLPDEL